jgi:hypothetical protein
VTRRPGFALVLSLLLVLVLAGLGAGIMALGLREAELARAMVRRAELQVAAESAARSVVAEWSTRRLDGLGMGGAAEVPVPDPHGDLVVSASILRIESDLFLVETTARADGSGPRGEARAAMLVRVLDPDVLLAVFPAGLVAQERVVLGEGFAAGDSAALAPEVEVGPSMVVDGEPGIVLGDPPHPSEPDPLKSPAIDLLASVRLGGGTVTPRPVEIGGQCVDDPLNWGAASDASPCYERLPLVHVTGDLEIEGGEGRGLVVVDGDLSVAGLRFEGILLVRGRVTLDAGTVIHGAVRASSIAVRGGIVHHDPALTRLALTAGGLDGAFRPAHRWWVPVF